MIEGKRWYFFLFSSIHKTTKVKYTCINDAHVLGDLLCLIRRRRPYQYLVLGCPFVIAKTVHVITECIRVVVELDDPYNSDPEPPLNNDITTHLLTVRSPVFDSRSVSFV
jgi:hypothetical protein